MAKHIRLTLGDITKLEVDAIVNAANERMLGGGGVDGAIHRAAGPRLLAACRALPEIHPGIRCPAGTCQITPGFDLPARFVIHTVGPVWHGGNDGEPEILRACYRNSLNLAVDRDLKSVAFPAISCGIYGYPLAQAAQIAVESVMQVVERSVNPIEVSFVAFDSSIHEAIARAIDENA